jgi:hypothetical protein
MLFMDDQTKTREILEDEAGRNALRIALPEVVDKPAKFGGALELPIGALATVFRVRESIQAELWERLASIPAKERTEALPVEPNQDYEGPDVSIASAAVSAPAAGKVNDTLEIVLDGPMHDNPFTDVELHAQFRLGDSELSVGGFYDGNGRYVIRFLPPKPGTWEFRTLSTARSLDGHTGTMTVEPSSATGPVRVADTFHFAYDNGEVYRPVGTTLYAWTHQSQELQEQTLATLAKSAFTKVRMCVFPKAYNFNDNEPELYPFNRDGDGWDSTRFNPAYFRHLEKRIRDLDPGRCDPLPPLRPLGLSGSGQGR